LPLWHRKQAALDRQVAAYKLNGRKIVVAPCVGPRCERGVGRGRIARRAVSQITVSVGGSMTSRGGALVRVHVAQPDIGNEEARRGCAGHRIGRRTGTDGTSDEPEEEHGKGQASQFDAYFGQEMEIEGGVWPANVG